MRGILLIATLSLLGAFAARAEDPLLAFMRDVDAHAKRDLSGFQAAVSAQFGVPKVQVRAVLGRVHGPADAFMIFQIGQMSHQPLDRVVPVYESHKGSGWGAIAKECGIKPGSPEFHALKNGDLHYGPRDRGDGKGHGKGKGKSESKGDD